MKDARAFAVGVRSHLDMPRRRQFGAHLPRLRRCGPRPCDCQVWREDRGRIGSRATGARARLRPGIATVLRPCCETALIQSQGAVRRLHDRKSFAARIYGCVQIGGGRPDGGWRTGCISRARTRCGAPGTVSMVEAWREKGTAGLSRRRGRKVGWRKRPREAPAEFEPPRQGPAALLAQAERRIADLERLVGRQQADLDFFRASLAGLGRECEPKHARDTLYSVIQTMSQQSGLQGAPAIDRACRLGGRLARRLLQVSGGGEPRARRCRSA